MAAVERACAGAGEKQNQKQKQEQEQEQAWGGSQSFLLMLLLLPLLLLLLPLAAKEEWCPDEALACPWQTPNPCTFVGAISGPLAREQREKGGLSTSQDNQNSSISPQREEGVVEGNPGGSSLFLVSVSSFLSVFHNAPTQPSHPRSCYVSSASIPACKGVCVRVCLCESHGIFFLPEPQELVQYIQSCRLSLYTYRSLSLLDVVVVAGC